MGTLPLFLLVWIGCAPVHTLESGSFVPLDDEVTLGITGININAADKLVLLVLDDSVHRWPMAPMASSDWPTGCADSRKEPVPEMSWEGTAEPLPLEDASPTHLRVSAWCEEEQHLRITSTDLPDWDLVLGPFDP